MSGSMCHSSEPVCASTGIQGANWFAALEKRRPLACDCRGSVEMRAGCIDMRPDANRHGLRLHSVQPSPALQLPVLQQSAGLGRQPWEQAAE